MEMGLDSLHQYAGALSCFSKSINSKYSALRVTAWSALVGAIPLLLLSGPHVFIMPFHITHGITLFALLYSIFFVTVFGLVMWYVGVQKLERHIRWYICI